MSKKNIIFKKKFLTNLTCCIKQTSNNQTDKEELRENDSED